MNHMTHDANSVDELSDEKFDVLAEQVSRVDARLRHQHARWLVSQPDFPSPWLAWYRPIRRRAVRLFNHLSKSPVFRILFLLVIALTVLALLAICIVALILLSVGFTSIFAYYGQQIVRIDPGKLMQFRVFVGMIAVVSSLAAGLGVMQAFRFQSYLESGDGVVPSGKDK